MKEIDVVERLGVLVDTAEGFLALQNMALSTAMQIDSLGTGIAHLRDGIKNLYFKIGGEDVWAVEDGTDA